MSRETSLVTADWVAENLKNPHVAIIEVEKIQLCMDRAISKTPLPFIGAKIYKMG